MTSSVMPFEPDFRTLVTDDRIEEYGRFQQHAVLIEDAARVHAFTGAIVRSKCAGVVVDVGAGTGLWGIFALRSGYDHAVLIEPSQKMCAYALHLARLNGVEDRVTIKCQTLESIRAADLPSSIDLVVTETLSSVIFGFGSWQALPRLKDRLSPDGTMIPWKGRLHAAFATRDYATRGAGKAGFGFLESVGFKIDLFSRAFRSGGNIYDKCLIEHERSTGRLKFQTIASFDFGSAACLSLEGAPLDITNGEPIVGVVLFWTVELTAGTQAETLSSLDDALTSWYPVFVPFTEPLVLKSGESCCDVRMVLRAIDAPYENAFEFHVNGRRVTHTLFW